MNRNSSSLKDFFIGQTSNPENTDSCRLLASYSAIPTIWQLDASKWRQIYAFFYLMMNQYFFQLFTHTFFVFITCNFNISRRRAIVWKYRNTGQWKVQKKKLLYNFFQWDITHWRLSIECLKTKTKVITLANHWGHRQSSEPIKTRSNYVKLTQSAGNRVGVSQDWFWFLLLIEWKIGANF